MDEGICFESHLRCDFLSEHDRNVNESTLIVYLTLDITDQELYEQFDKLNISLRLQIVGEKSNDI